MLMQQGMSMYKKGLDDIMMNLYFQRKNCDIDPGTILVAGHRHWVLVTAWSTDGERLASACKAGQIFIWDPKTGKQVSLSAK